jgi:hypothetical protein
MSKYAKAIIALLGTVVTWAISTFPANHNVQIIGGLATSLLTVASVYHVPNTDNSND